VSQNFVTRRMIQSMLSWEFQTPKNSPWVGRDPCNLGNPISIFVRVTCVRMFQYICKSDFQGNSGQRMVKTWNPQRSTRGREYVFFRSLVTFWTLWVYFFLLLEVIGSSKPPRPAISVKLITND